MENDKKKSQSSIPTGKVKRAAKFVRTGAKMGKNYAKYYARKAANREDAREVLDRENAEDVYETLSELKGSALKMAQMMSMHQNVMPQAYTDKFKMSQYSAPPLSLPLVVKTFQKNFGKSPFEMFDSFSKEAVHAASIGQVHEAYLGEKKLAVKVQYPGVADSVRSDLRLVKPIATRIMNLSEKDINLYMKEVEDMLISETDYDLELKRSQSITDACRDIPNLRFSEYYKEFSCKRILSMDWLEGEHIDTFLESEPSQEVRDKIGQALWDFYDFQIHRLLEVHADPHPGNFLMRKDGTVGVIDFGCVKVIPEEYYKTHFQVINPQVLKDDEIMEKVFFRLGFISSEDTPEEKRFFSGIFRNMLELTTRPFRSESFDFGNDEYFNELYTFGEELSKKEELRKSKKARGSEHALYMNRSYFGLYYLLNQLKAHVKTESYWFEREDTALA